MEPDNRHKKMTLFVSYAHDDSTEFSEELVMYLRSRGHEVNIDREFIHDGNYWEEDIVKALDSTCRAMPDARLLFVLSPQSVNTEKYCLNELAYAISENLRVVPLKLDNVKMPLSIFRIQFIDCQYFWKWKDEGKKRELFSRIEESILFNKLDETGFVNSLSALLDPIESEKLSLMWKVKYHERRWIDREIDRWLENDCGSKLLCITGGPGFGKSLFSKHLINSKSNIIAFHFCMRNNDSSSNLKRIVKTLVCQIASQYEAYKEMVLEIVSRKADLNVDANTLFDQLIVSPLRRLDAMGRGLKVRKFILVDALDEAIEDSGYSIAFILSQKKDELPDWIRIITTSRPVPNIMSYFGDCDVLNLENESYYESNRMGLSEYIRCELAELKDDVHFEEAVRTIIEKAKGIFLYVTNICADIKANKLDISKPYDFPKSIDNYYADFFTFNFKRNKENVYYKGVARLLAVILSARQPLDGGMLKRILGIEVYQLNDMIKSMGNFLRTNSEKEYVVYHASLKDWLVDGDRNRDFQIDQERGDRLFVELGYSSNLGNKLKNYQLRHLPKHLSNCGRIEDLERLFNDEVYLNELDRAGMRHEMVDVYFENMYYTCKVSTNRIDAHKVFKSRMMEHLLITYSLYMFDHNYYAKLADFGFDDFLEEEDFTSLSPLLRARTFSYYHITGQFNRSIQMDISDLSDKLAGISTDKERSDYAGFCNMAGVAYRIFGNFEVADRLISKASELYEELKNDNAVQVINANLARSYKFQMRFDECEEILEEGADYAMELEVPKVYNKRFEENLHVCNGPMSLIIEFYLDRMDIARAEEYLEHIGEYYKVEEAQKGRFYPLYLINCGVVCLMKGDIEGCFSYLDLSDRYPGRESFANMIRDIACVHEYVNGRMDRSVVEKTIVDMKENLRWLAKGYQWEKYASNFPLYQLCCEMIGVECRYARRYPADAFKAWEGYKREWYERVINYQRG